MATARPVVIVGAGDPAATDRLATHLRSNYVVHTAYDGDAVVDSLDESVDVVLVHVGLPDLSLHTLYERQIETDVSVQVGLLTTAAETPTWIDATIDPEIDDEELTRIVDWLATRSTYRKKLDTFYDLASEHANLASTDEPAADPRELERRLDRLRTEIDDAVADLDDQSLFEVALDDYDTGE
ncbi:MAG: HalX domain-containing protein [Halapricum sp.]